MPQLPDGVTVNGGQPSPYASPAWRRIRLLVFARDGKDCQIHGPKCLRDATEVDHIVTLSDGGAPYDPANLRAACKPCNGGRAADRTNAQRRYRTAVPDYQTRL